MFGQNVKKCQRFSALPCFIDTDKIQTTMNTHRLTSSFFFFFALISPLTLISLKFQAALTCGSTPTDLPPMVFGSLNLNRPSNPCVGVNPTHARALLTCWSLPAGFDWFSPHRAREAGCTARRGMRASAGTSTQREGRKDRKEEWGKEKRKKDKQRDTDSIETGIVWLDERRGGTYWTDLLSVHQRLCWWARRQTGGALIRSWTW